MRAWVSSGSGAAGITSRSQPSARALKSSRPGAGFGVDDDVAAPHAVGGGVFRALEDVGHLEGHPACGVPDKGLTVRGAVE